MRFIPRAIAIAFILVFAARGFATDLRHVEDATLRSVHFIDDKEGWAVGDEGVILHTLDGGAIWHRQPSGVRASLRSVQFLNASVGWAVGREELPYGMGSVGVILFTNDGGLEWKKQLANTLPGMNQVRFVDQHTGYLLGDATDQFPSGLFRTTDSGKSWERVPGPRATTWLAGDFYDARTGILVGGSSRLATVRNGKVTLAEHADSLSSRDITGLQILGKKTLAVAQGGLILNSVSGGSAWDFAKTNLPTEVIANLDFHAMHAVKENVWIVGRPGSVVLHSTDSGTTWNVQKTGQPLPLHGIFFFDAKLGWAVGDAGTILKTTDGGKTWNTRHQAAQRLAALCVHSSSKSALVDTLAILGASEGHVAAGLRISAPDAGTALWTRAHDPRRHAAAMRLAGAIAGETLWHFPVPQYLEGCDKRTILAHWNKLHKDTAEEELIRQLVLALRIWRPSVVIGEHPASKSGLSALLGDALAEAVRQAADDKAHPEQIEQLGLQAWQVRRLYGVDSFSPLSAGGEGPGVRGDGLIQDNEEPRDVLERSARDYALAAHGLLTDRFTMLPKQRTHVLAAAMKQATVERHWLEGIDSKVGETRRNMKLDGKTDAKLHDVLRQRRSAIALAETLDDPAKSLTLLPAMLDKLPDDHATEAAFAIASRFAERGQWYLAQETYLYMVDRSPAHPLSAEAYRWLVRLNTSSEARRRHELKHFGGAEPVALAKKSGILRVGHEEPAERPALLTSRPETRDWNKGAFELVKRLGGYGPAYGYHPQAHFCLQSSKRHQGELGASQEWMSKFRNFVPGGPWHEAARAEAWLANRTEAPPHKVGRARYTEVRPYLDGKFDDPCWQNLKPMKLDNAVGESAKDHVTEAMFAFDQEFLYIALTCTHPAGKQVDPVKPRQRDADLDAFDRVGILLDLDRDYSTAYHLEVDQRGCVRDSCWGDRTWNPRWFVAVHSDQTSWQIEAAIPLSELSSDRIAQHTAWAFNIVRTIPARGVQSWSQPADVAPCPEGMSVLLFETGKARPMPVP
jgi:photosystem II stability/assembly factor-like uncharacterized protein